MAEVLRNAAGQPWSQWKPAERFEVVMREKIGQQYVTEYVFDSTRKWRLDFAWIEQKVAVEVSGFGWGHQAQQHIAADNEKRNAATAQGWIVLVYDSRLLGSRQKVEDAVEQVFNVLCDRQ